MKNILNTLSEEEKSRIINLHVKAKKNSFLSEQQKPITVPGQDKFGQQMVDVDGNLPPQKPTTTPVTTTTTTSRQQKQYTDKYTKEIQTKLVGMGFNLGNSGPQKNGVDGLLGPTTSKAIYDLLTRYQDMKLQLNNPISNIQPKTAQSIQSTQPVAPQQIITNPVQKQ